MTPLAPRKVVDLQSAILRFQDLIAHLELLKNQVPVGTVMGGVWTLDAIPDGFLFCDGRSNLGNKKYPLLFKSLGYRYGGDGSTMFAVPDLRGKVMIGAAADLSVVNARPGSYNAGIAAVGSYYPAFNVTWIIKAD